MLGSLYGAGARADVAVPEPELELVVEPGPALVVAPAPLVLVPAAPVPPLPLPELWFDPPPPQALAAHSVANSAAAAMRAPGAAVTKGKRSRGRTVVMGFLAKHRQR
jgi:hypothetical protein